MTLSLPAEDHVLRYVPNQRLLFNDGGEVVGIFPQALELRSGEEYLSATWIEHYDMDYEKGFSAAANVIRQQLRVGGRSGFASAQVGSIVSTCAEAGVKVRILHEPEPDNSGHAAIRGLQKAEIELLALLAADTFKDIRLATSV